MTGIRIKDWEKFQHYKSGSHADKPPDWIKLYKRLLDDIEWHKLPGDDAKLLVELWMLASEHGGSLPSIEKIAFRLRRSEKTINAALDRLPHWIELPSRQALDDGYTASSLEEEEEEEEEENKKEKENGANAPSDEIVFQGSYVKRVTKANMTAWLQSYPALDPVDAYAEISLCDDYYSSIDDPPPKWFFTTSAWLKRENDRRLKLRRDSDELERSIYSGAI